MQKINLQMEIFPCYKIKDSSWLHIFQKLHVSSKPNEMSSNILSELQIHKIGRMRRRLLIILPKCCSLANLVSFEETKT